MTKSEFFDEDPSAPKASFQGQLSIQDFMFKASSSQSGSTSTQSPSRITRTSTAETMLTRRSPRLATPVKALSTPASPSPSPSLKRKSSASTSASASASPSQTPKKKKKKPKSQGYAPPSTYAHLPPLADVLAPNLLVLFIGLNPGVQTARTGHAYAHPSNLFWKLLHSSGITPVPCRADEDRTLPARFACGNTNIVARPSRSGAELARSELDAGVSVLEAKIRRWRPEVACIVGKSIWESVWRVRRGGGRRAPTKAEFRYGWQDERENMGRVQTTRGVLGGGDGGDDEAADVAEGVVVDPNWNGARVFVASSTSGLAASLSPAEKERIWRELGEWVEKRREEKGIKKEDLI